VIVRFYTVPNVRAARYSAGWALLFIAILYTTAPAIAGFARYNLVQSLHNSTPEEVQQLDWATKWENTGLLAFEDLSGDGTVPVHSPMRRANEITVDRDIMVLATPEVANLAPFVIALVAAGGLAAALSTASGLLLVSVQFHRPRLVLPHYQPGSVGVAALDGRSGDGGLCHRRCRLLWRQSALVLWPR
jgi:cation/acetate symporter